MNAVPVAAAAALRPEHFATCAARDHDPRLQAVDNTAHHACEERGMKELGTSSWGEWPTPVQA